MGKTDNKVKEIMTETIKEVYEDGAKETIKETSKVISLIPRTIHAILLKLEKWILNREYSLKMTQKMLEYKLAKYDPSQVEDPEPYVAVPTINALSYTYASEDLLDLYANLLASSMIKDKKWRVHPSFVEIIKQLSPDEARILKELSKNDGENEFPIIRLFMEKKDENERFLRVNNYTNIFDSVCEKPNNISIYLDNLVRLQLIEIFESEAVSGYDYSPILKSDYIEEFKNKTTLYFGYSWIVHQYMFKVTDFGLDFISICVSEENNSH